MDCRSAQKLSDQYLAGTLPTDLMPEYLRHIRSCPDCLDNLRTDYSITKAIDQINHDQDFSTDYNRDLMQMLERSRVSILRRIRIMILKRAVVIAVLVAIAVFLATRTPEKMKYYLPAGGTESVRLYYYGIEDRYDPVNCTIRERNNEVLDILREEKRNEDVK
ncbi:MAG: zf-HC2 domain-containing protein [Lachnospiraceae bacterium]|nr:zf-HC2 domain-containing protein [Lachnospiraceae bacterium]